MSGLLSRPWSASVRLSPPDGRSGIQPSVVGRKSLRGCGDRDHDRHTGQLRPGRLTKSATDGWIAREVATGTSDQPLHA